MRVTKDGASIFEIDDSQSSVKAAADKGYKEVIEMSKDGVDWHDVIGTEDSVMAAMDKGYKPRESKPTPSTTPHPSKWESLGRGVAQGVTFGFGDELSGALHSAISDDTYEESRDKIRRQNKEAETENPLTYMGGEFAGGAVMPIGAGGAAKTIAGAALKGAGAGALAGGLSGVGYSNAKDYTDNAWDGVKGASIGALAGGVVGGAANVIGRGVTKAGRAGLGDEFSAFQRGTKEDTLLQGTPGFETAARWYNGANETFKSSKAVEQFNKVVAKDIESSHLPTPTSDKMDEYILLRLNEDGPNEIKKWFADSSSNSGGFASEKLQNIIDKSPAERTRLRNFEPRNDAEGIADLANKSSESFNKANMDKVKDLTLDASFGFDGKDPDTIKALSRIAGAKLDSESDSMIPANIGKRIDSTIDLIVDGKGPSFFGLDSTKHYTDTTNFDMFARFQKAREKLDEGIDWEGINRGNKMTLGEQILVRARDAIDEKLKTTPGKKDADKIYQNMVELEKAVFSNTEHGGKIDKYKLSRLLNDTDRSARFKDNLQSLKDWSKDEQFDKSAREAASNFVEAFEKSAKDMFSKQEINKFNFRDGPSSPAIQRLGSQLNKDGVVQDAIKNPSTFLSSNDEFIRKTTNIVGKEYKDMNLNEKKAFIGVRVWLEKQIRGGVTPTEGDLKSQFVAILRKLN